MDTALFLTFLAASSALSQQWRHFKTTYRKSYGSLGEEVERMNIFEENFRIIEEHNKNYKKGLVSFEMGLNFFGDMRFAELKETILLLDNKDLPSDIPTYTYLPPATLKEAPRSVNWTKEGAVTKVKDQKLCGSSWAFSATGALEGQHFRKTRKLVALSEQQLVDCSSKYGNYGCGGGLPDRAYKYIIYNKGIARKREYPYEGKESECRYKHGSNVIVTAIMGVAEDEEMLKKAVATVGPISICIHVTEQFIKYKQGIFIDKTCSSENLNHAVLVVGYGSEGNEDYWLVKNSWGSRWGDRGYIKMARNKKNQCGVASVARYPLV